jgi:hypothetical protein
MVKRLIDYFIFQAQNISIQKGHDGSKFENKILRFIPDLRTFDKCTHSADIYRSSHVSHQVDKCPITDTVVSNYFLMHLMHDLQKTYYVGVRLNLNVDLQGFRLGRPFGILPKKN